MTVKEYLSQAFSLNQKIKNTRERLVELNNQRFSVASIVIGEHVQSSPKQDKIGETTVLFDELVRIYTTDTNNLLKLKYDIQMLIDKVEQDNYRELLKLRYIDLKRFDDIADEMNFKDVRWVYSLHKKSLEFIEVHVQDVF